jgi:magnesium-transporting ATPase (P-type)
MKVWMLTGDKTETAINIGFSANFLTADMATIVIKAPDLKSTISQMLDALKGCFQVDMDPTVARTVEDEDDMNDRLRRETALSKKVRDASTGKVALVIDGQSLKFALEKSAEMVFLHLAIRCHTVICCRVTPLQKGKVVALVKQKLQVMTLAIGDGANDVAMIQEANVGIGIQGLEGMQAVLASDYAIAQFSFLNKLLLVHGRWSYARIATMTLHMFYKNFVWTLALFWYQRYCGWSGTILYDYFLILLYNLVFTVALPFAIGVFDQDLQAKRALQTPEAYRNGIRGNRYSLKRFVFYMLDGVYQSLVCFYQAYLIVQEASIFPGGYSGNFAFLGLITSTNAVITANLSMASDSIYWSAILQFALYFGIGIYVIAVMVTSQFQRSNLNGVFGLLGNSVLLLSIPLTLTLCQLPRLVVSYVQHTYYPKDLDILQEMQKYEIDPVRTDGATEEEVAPNEVPMESLPLASPISGAKVGKRPLRVQTAPSVPTNMVQRMSMSIDKVAQPLRRSLNEIASPLARASSLIYVRNSVMTRPNRGFAFSQEPGLATHLPQLTSPAAQSLRRRSMGGSRTRLSLGGFTPVSPRSTLEVPDVEVSPVGLSDARRRRTESTSLSPDSPRKIGQTSD